VIRIAIVGDFNAKYHTHVAINTGIRHSAASLGADVAADWIATPDIAKFGAARMLSVYDAVWAAPVSPYESAEGMLRAIEYARTAGIPFTGT
jgi:CTP synthase (UTP-ammonia lyase)